MNATAPHHQRGMAPVDLQTMRSQARLVMVLNETGDLPEPPALDTMALMLRGMIEVLAPEVEAVAVTLPKDDVPRACALACVGESRMRLRLGSGDTRDVRQSVVVKLARSLNALCDHHTTLRRPS
ncbi:DUF6415 family natural product biosynthesis protein [Streptomyces sp. NPDC048594]|uniref:DUF6415 family natural product biosynthesis protein n=1 Tax=Streptomyces sp. NPDC048594 TaxID=3365575 RepID=UPI00371912BA